jgi:hypothetical protein
VRWPLARRVSLVLKPSRSVRFYKSVYSLFIRGDGRDA